MANYKILEMDNIPDVLKTKPRLATCISLALGMCVVTASAVTIGVIIGYTYCYLEHHSGFRPVTGVGGNYSHSSYHQIIKVSKPESQEAKYKRTINGALASSVLVTKIISLGQAFVQDHLPWFEEEANHLLHHP